jgi:type I restriction enzyme, S subunit
MSWKTVKIGSFLKERTGRYKPTQANAMGLKRVEKIDFSGTYHLVDKPTNTDMILVRKGDLLISGINAEKGAVTIYRDEEDALATIHYSSYEFDETKIYIDYFKWFLISNAFKNLLRASAGSGIKTELKSKHLLPLEVNLPPLVEQIEIVESINSRQARLKTIDTEVNQQQTYLQLLRQTIMQEAVEGRLNECDLSNWKSVLLSDVIVDTPKNGFSPKPVEYKTNTRCLTLTATTSGTFDRTKFKYIEDIPPNSQFWLEPGDVLIQRGNSLEYVGIAAIYTGASKEFTYPDLMIKIRANEKITTEFLHLVLIGNSTRRYFRENASGTSGSMPKINQRILNNTRIPLPPLAEQQRIVAKVQQLQQQLSKLEAQVQQSRQYAQQLLQGILKETFKQSTVAADLEEATNG